VTASLDCFAVAAPGLSPIVASELDGLGLSPSQPSDAGVAFRASLRQIYQTNLHLRVASRILVRLATFRAAHFSELEKGAAQIAWDRWLKRGSRVDLRVTCRKSRLYHSGAVAERLATHLEGRGVVARQLSGLEDETEGTAQLVVVRIDRDECTISLDSSGELLHRRGYRKAVGRAPLRETLAAAMLLASCSDDRRPVVDPMCGSGTLPIEAALRARSIPPGLRRRFAFELWPDFEEVAWTGLKAEASHRILPRAPNPIVGADRDAGVIESARANAERAGVASDIEFVHQPLSAATRPTSVPGLFVVNPPYGERVSAGKELRDLYARLGDVVRREFPDWAVGILAADAKLIAATRLPLTSRFTTSNGGIRVQLWAMG
jgi:putative N6-adenine-specific DNA methylase